jgi:hypothetical protein
MREEGKGEIAGDDFEVGEVDTLVALELAQRQIVELSGGSTTCTLDRGDDGGLLP